MGIEIKDIDYKSGDLVVLPDSTAFKYEARGSKGLPFIASVDVCSQGKNLSSLDLYQYGFDKIEPENLYLVIVPFDSEFSYKTFGCTRLIVDIYKVQPLYFQRDVYVYDSEGNEYTIKKILPKLDKKTYDRYAGRNSGIFFMLNDGVRTREVEYQSLVKNYDIFK